MSIDILTPVGRMIGGHPLEAFPVMDDTTKLQKIDKAGQPRTSSSVGIAIAKGPETDWKQTEWGQQIYQVAAAAWPAGEFNAPAFAWKVIDGDSAIPNKRGSIPNQREGYAGHWVIRASTELPIKCYNAGHYELHEVIQRKEAIKRGDYIRLLLSIKGNNPSQSPGVYINPSLFELVRAGIEIVTASGPSASDAFAGVAAQLPAGAQVDPNVSAIPAGMPQASGAIPPAQPHPGFVENAAAGTASTPPLPPAQPAAHIMTASAGGATYEELIAAGWTDDTLIQHGHMLP